MGQPVSILNTLPDCVATLKNNLRFCCMYRVMMETLDLLDHLDLLEKRQG